MTIYSAVKMNKVTPTHPADDPPTRLGFVGDWLPRRGIQPKLLSSSAVVWVGNLECAFADTTGNSSAKAYPVVVPNTDFESATSWPFSALNLANNHSADAGKWALEKLACSIAEKTSIVPYGLVDRPYAELNVGGFQCAVLGCMERVYSRHRSFFPAESVEQAIRHIRPSMDYVFVTPHWGYEGELAGHPSPRQRNLARCWIEAGADGVFGHHSHTVQGCEWIHGKPVYYSLGNFSFDHAEGKEWPLTWVGLAVEWRPDRPTKVQHCFLFHHPTPVEESDEVRSQAEAYFRHVSEDLKKWNTLEWARAVGPYYIAKSDRSWRLRLSRSKSATTLLKCLVWNCLPKTLLMRFCRRLPPSEALMHVQHMEDCLIHAAKGQQK